MNQQHNTRRIALTFEVGGDPEICERALDRLRSMQTVATIFLDGEWVQKYPDLLRQMANDGHEFGNHAYSHPDLTQLDNTAVLRELQRTDALTVALTGQRAHPWFRPPFAAADQRIQELVAREGYCMVQRNAIDGGHWPGTTTEKSIRQRSLDHAYDGAVLTYHLNNPKTLAVLTQIIGELRDRGYEMVRLSDLPAVSEYPERQAAFAHLPIEPGYLQPMLSGTHAWSLNVLEFGARAQGCFDTLVPLVATDRTVIQLLAVNETSCLPVNHDRYLLVVTGELDCTFQVAKKTVLRARGRPGDLILWAKTYELRVQAVDDACRDWILLVIE